MYHEGDLSEGQWRHHSWELSNTNLIRACAIWFALVGPDNLPSNLNNSMIFGDESEPSHSCFSAFVEFEPLFCAYILKRQILRKRHKIDEAGAHLFPYVKSRLIVLYSSAIQELAFR